MDEEERRDLLGRLFSLMTAKLEDAATLAADGQSAAAGTPARLRLAQAIQGAAGEVATVAEATAALLQDG